MQLPLFISDAAPGCIPTRKRYTRHCIRHVKWLGLNYRSYSLAECAAQLGLTVPKVKYLLRTHGIKKRAPNGLGRRSGWQPAESAPNPSLGLAA